MPVNVPRLQQFQTSSNTPQNTRIQASAPDTTSLITTQTNAINQVAGQLGDVYQQYENDKIKQATNEAEIELDNWERLKLQELKSVQGDPTEAYVNFESEREQKYQEITSRYGDASQRVQDHLQGNLGTYRAKTSGRIDYQRNAQMETYKHNLYKSSMKLRRDNIADGAGFIQIEGEGLKQGSTFQIDSTINETYDLVAQRGIDNGTATILPDDAKSFDHAYKDEDGKLVKVKFSNIAKAEAGETISQGLKTAVESLIAAGDVDKAELLKKKYASAIAPKDENKLTSMLSKGKTRREANEIFAGIQGLDEDQQVAAIEKISDPEKRDAVSQLKISLDRKMDFFRQQKEQRNLEAASKYIMENQGKFYGRADLEADSRFQQLAANMSPKAVENMRKLVDPPKTSDLRAQVELSELFNKGEEANLTPEQFAQKVVNLDETDRRQAWNRYNKRKSGKKSPYTTAYNTASKRLTNELFAKELVKSGGNRKVSKKDFPKYNEMLNNLNDALDQAGVDNNTPPAELNKIVDDLVKSAKTQELFGRSSSGGFFTSLFGGGEESPKELYDGLSRIQQVRIKAQYKRANGITGNVEDNDDNFLNYVAKIKG